MAKKAFNGQYAYQYNAIADKILQQSDRLTSSSPHQSTPKPKSTITIATPSQSTTLSQSIPQPQLSTTALHASSNNAQSHSLSQPTSQSQHPPHSPNSQKLLAFLSQTRFWG